MPMPFFDDPITGARIPTLISRMLALHQAVEADVITPDELTVISRLSTQALQSKSDGLMSKNGLESSDSTDIALQKLFNILKDVKELAIMNAEPLINGMERFDSEHGEYLSLLPLVGDNDQTLSLSLNDFAIFYQVFIRHMSYQQEAGELGDQYSFDFDQLAARTDWLKWQQTRPARISFDPSTKNDLPGLFEKFLAGKLKRDEWLTDLDIQRELRILGLQDKTYIVPFKEDDIGLVLHFEREKHQLDDPKEPYVIPLVVNLGEDGHSRLDSRGVHWTRMLVTVDPRQILPQITVDYTDELYLHDGAKKAIEKTLRNALKYRTELGGYTKGEDLKIYQAYPECDEPTINITGSDEQKDGFSCGYRALRGILADLIKNDVVAENETYRAFLNCTDSSSLCNFVYSSLLGEQPISKASKDNIKEVLGEDVFKETSEDNFVIDSTLVEGQLLALSHPAAKKKGKTDQLNSQLLEQLVEQNKKMNALREVGIIKNIATSSEESMELNLQDILDKLKSQESDPALVLQVVFEQVSKNSTLSKLKLVGTEAINEQQLHEKIDGLPLRILLSSSEPNLEHYLAVLNARNTLLESRNIKTPEGTDPWDALFENMLFTPSIQPSGNRFEWLNLKTDKESKAVATMGVAGFVKLLQYCAAHKDRFADKAFPFEEFSMRNSYGIDKLSGSNLGLLHALKEHLQSELPFIPFKRFHLALSDLAKTNNDELIAVLSEILEAKPPLERLEIETVSLADLSEQSIQTLIDIIKEKKYSTILSFSSQQGLSPGLQLKLQDLENAALINKRQRLTPAGDSISLSHKTTTMKDVVLGKIGKAILNTEGLEGLAIEVQIQDQQQQQVQQQIQTALSEEELPEEDELDEEQFAPYTDMEDLLTRDDMSKKNPDIYKLIVNRHPHLKDDPQICWDLIAGAKADLFKYGIKKMTVSAAKVLIDHLQDVQYGLHPDNLPRGFSLQQDKEGDVVLAYTSFNPPINPNESPLTIKFSQPQAANQWSGNALQFFKSSEQKDTPTPREQAELLYKEIIASLESPLPTLDECISHFFFLKNDTLVLNASQRLRILSGFIEGMTGEDAASIQKQIEGIFGKTLSISNVNALSEVLYEQGPQALSVLLDDLRDIKKIKGDNFFASFKTCFIDRSQNLNELTTKAARASMQKLLTLSSAQTAWWLSLTEQHTSNLSYQPESGHNAFTVIQAPGQRWANLAELTEGFDYFCGQLEEVRPGLKLTEFCPLSDVADMRVALDRLLTTILPNALDVNEQFYEGLQGLSLDPLGPFYASRYEGFKLVTPEMKLDTDTSMTTQDNFFFRCDKWAVMEMIYCKAPISLIMRYIAINNHRAPQEEYLAAYEKIAEVDSLEHSQESLLVILAGFGAGKRGKNFTQADISHLVKWTEDKASYLHSRVLFAWQFLINFPVRPTIAEVIQISDLALSSNNPEDSINNVKTSISLYDSHAQDYIEALVLLANNKKNMGFDNFQNILFNEEAKVAAEEEEAKAHSNPEIDFPIKTRLATVKLLAICDSTNLVNETAALDKAGKLFTAVRSCLAKHKEQTTMDLLELLGHIDMEKSENLPSLDDLVELINTVAENDKPDYSELERTVKSGLSENCIIQMEEVTAAPLEPVGNLHTIITKYMNEIREQLAANKPLIDAQLGEGFFDSLATPEGARRLLAGLENIAQFSGFLGDVVKGKVVDVMLKVYDSVKQEGIKGVGIKNDKIRLRLAKIVNNKVHHPITKESDFNQFSKLYAKEMESLSQLLGHLQSLNKTWPTDFNKILDAMDNSPNLNSYPLSLLAKITGALAANFDKNAPFPTELLQQFLAFEKVNENENTRIALNGIVEEVFDKDRSDDIHDTEKRLLCEIGLRYCQDAGNPQASPNVIKGLLALRESDGALFVPRLKLLSGCEKIDDQTLRSMNYAIEVVSKLKNPALVTNTLDFFTEDLSRAKDFISITTELGKINDLHNRGLVLAIALKAAQPKPGQQWKSEEQGEELRQVIEKLNTVNPEILQQLDTFYRSPRHPDLSSLNRYLSDTSRPLNEEVLQTLQVEYDRDYWLQSEKEEERKYRNFDTSQLAGYLDNLWDMNYNRPLLLSQREELQRWFLYINAIGNNRAVPTHLNPDISSFKPFSKMSHGEIQGLLECYRTQLKDKTISPEQRLKLRLETIALLREAMYRGTGKFPRPTQILYLLTAMQSGKDFIAQIQTGQGKSLTAALAAAMANIEGKTVHVYTSNSFLASEGLAENHDFFEYLGIPAKHIHDDSDREAYQKGAIHYSSKSELALYRSKWQLQGKVFPEAKDCTDIGDESDFITFDDITRDRVAVTLDPVTDPYKSPYTWIYEALVGFVDTQTAPKTEEEFLEQAKLWLRHSAKSKEEKTQLKELEAQPEVYKKRLETWLVAAGLTHWLVKDEDKKFRVVTLEHKKYGQVSKACILTDARPNIQAEFSDTVQQFLHLRLRQKYRSQIDQANMPEFLVEPEKTYITSLNTKILLNMAGQRWCMSGTPIGSIEEAKELYAKYNFRIVSIPDYTESKRQDLKPILTNPKLVSSPEAESRDHINRIVKETLRYLSQQKGGLAGPILIHCEDRAQGEKIYQALNEAISKNPRKYKNRLNEIQRFYSSEEPTPDKGNEEEQAIKEKAGEDGMITISTVFGRGTDIKPNPDKGLYTIDSFVDTDPYSSADLERSKRQKIGRAGRAGNVGYTRLIIRRSEFSDVYKPEQMRKIPDTVEGLDQAISTLNALRNKKRVVERESREYFDDVKDIIYQKFFEYIKVINNSGDQVPKQQIRNKLTKQWSLLLSRIDNRWEELQHDPAMRGRTAEQRKVIAEFACEQWNELAKEGGDLRRDLSDWASFQKLTLSLPEVEPVKPEEMISTITYRNPLLEPYYVKRVQQYGKVDPNLSEAAVYCDFLSSQPFFRMTEEEDAVRAAREEVTGEYIAHQLEGLTTQAHQQKLSKKFDLKGQANPPQQVEQIMGALLYLRYKAHRDGNPRAHARLSGECRRFEKQMLWSQDNDLIEAVVRAQKLHFNTLTNHRGDHEAQKGEYLTVIMSEARRLLPEQTSEWKADFFPKWWAGDAKVSGVKAQAVGWLTAYKDKWWTRSWVSGDRKKLVATLLENLQKPKQNPQNILNAIAEARQHLLSDDKKHSRSLKSGINGRLNQYLNELELKVQAAMAPDMLDENTSDMLDNNIKVLKQAAARCYEGDALRQVLSVLDDKTTAQEKYQALSVFFNNIRLMAKPKKTSQDNWDSFQTYCQQTKWQMVRYFAQCDKNSSFNEQGSIQVYQAASEAAAVHFQGLMGRDNKLDLNLPKDRIITYRDKNISFNVHNLGLINKGSNSPIFKKINQAETYRELLFSLEKAIVENSPNDAQVHFNAVTLSPSEHYPEEGFQLTVEMLIDGVKAEIHYHINMKTGEMYCDDQGLQELKKPRPKNPELESLTQGDDLKDIKKLLADIRSSKEALTTSTKDKISSARTEIEEMQKRLSPDQTVTSKYKKELDDLKEELEIISETFRQS